MLIEPECVEAVQAIEDQEKERLWGDRRYCNFQVQIIPGHAADKLTRSGVEPYPALSFR